MSSEGAHLSKAAVILMLLVLPALGSAAGDLFTVTYRSAEHVYLDGGEADGLTLGARLIPDGATDSAIVLDVVFVAMHSASCTAIGDPTRVRVGDKFRITGGPARDTATAVSSLAAPVVVDTVAREIAVPIRRGSEAGPVSGNVSLLAYLWNDRTEANLDFTQVTTRVSLRARRLWGREFAFAMRGRGRFDQRARAISSGIGRQDWQNRLWECSISYEDPAAPVNVYAGRVLPRRSGGIGYLDGLVVEGILSSKVRTGLFGGVAPDWVYEDRHLSLTKGGGYLSITTRRQSGLSFDQSLGLVGEYHGGVTSREYFVMQGSVNWASNWGATHVVEIDINRGWRRERAGREFELSNLFANMWVRVSQGLRLSLSYDNRTNYWTYDTRTTVDSLFDDNLRQGIRVQSDVSLPAQVFASGSLGYHKRTGDPDPTRSYSARIRKTNLLIRRLSLAVQYAGFDGPSSRGYNVTLRGDRSMGRRHSVAVEYGRYAYRSNGVASFRTNDWLQLSDQIDLGRHYWLGGQIQFDAGDDIKGFRMQSEVGYRF
jgi:hypothetical protein